MSSLGTFGRKRAAIDLDLDWFEATIRVNPSACTAAMVEFLAEAGAVDQDDEIRGSQIIMRLLREVIHPEDFDLFWKIAKRERQDPQTDLVPMANAIMEAVTDFPTPPSSASADGPSTTPPRSVAAVSLPATAPPTPNLTPSTADLALRQLHGRPDLQEFIVQAEQQRAQTNGTTV